MFSEAKRLRESYDRRSYMLQNTKQDRGDVFRGKIERRLFNG